MLRYIVVFSALCLVAANISAAEQRIDVAGIITKAEAESVLGETVKDSRPRNDEGPDGYYSRCNYYSQNPGKSLVLRVRHASEGQLEPKKQLEMLSAGNGKFVPLPGLGDKAQVLTEAAENGISHALMLYVAKGNALITVGVGGIDDEKQALDKAKTVARKILAQL